MPVKILQIDSDSKSLNCEAEELLAAYSCCALAAAQRIREFHPSFAKASDAEIFGAAFHLSDAELTVAREHGFPSWARLIEQVGEPDALAQLRLPHHQRIQDGLFRNAVDLVDAGDASGLRILLQQHPDLVQQRIAFEGGNYFRNPSLLEFIAENPVRHGTLPPNIVEIAQVILDAQPDSTAKDEALILVATGSVPRECDLQTPLIELLCRYGADPDSASHAAALHGEHGSLHALLRSGATLDLPIAAALGDLTMCQKLLASANPQQRHLALALASQFGRLDIVRLLLDAGEDPDRYNPPGGHSHTTPLHQAAGEGYEEMVRLFVERGARLDIRDLLWQGTPAGWANYGGQPKIEEYLKTEADARPAKAEDKL